MVHGIVFERPRLIAKVAGYNGRFLSLMLPRSAREKPAKVERLPSIDNSLAMRITFAEVEDTFVWAYEHNLLEAGDVKARGQWTIVRRSRHSRRILNSVTYRPPDGQGFGLGATARASCRGR
jgi:hypothetical protein